MLEETIHYHTTAEMHPGVNLVPGTKSRNAYDKSIIFADMRVIKYHKGKIETDLDDHVGVYQEYPPRLNSQDTWFSLGVSGRKKVEIRSLMTALLVLCENVP